MFFPISIIKNIKDWTFAVLEKIDEDMLKTNHKCHIKKSVRI